MSVKVRLQGSLYALLIVVLAVVIPAILGLTSVALVFGFLGTVAMFVDTTANWAINDPMLTKLLGRPLAAKFFHQVFGVNPPPRRDYLAMKVCNEVVSKKLKELKEARNDLYEQENKRVSAELTPQGVEKRIAENRELHSKVEAAKDAYSDAKWLAELLGFDTWRL